MINVRCRRLNFGRPTDLPATGPRGEWQWCGAGVRPVFSTKQLAAKTEGRHDWRCRSALALHAGCVGGYPDAASARRAHHETWVSKATCCGHEHRLAPKGGTDSQGQTEPWVRASEGAGARRGACNHAVHAKCRAHSRVICLGSVSHTGAHILS